MSRHRRMTGDLSVLKSHVVPNYILFFDTETHVIQKDDVTVEFPFRLGIAIGIKYDKNSDIHKQDDYRFSSASDFVELLISLAKPKQKIYVMAHNVGFDVRVLDLPLRFSQLGFISEPPIINDRVFIWSVKINTCTFEFLDTANFGVSSVADLGKTLGFEKGEVDFNTEDDELLAEYCKRDVEILVKFMSHYLKFINLHGLGSFKVTLAGQSLTAFRTTFMENKPFIHNYDVALELERQAYHGGRVECFHIGKLPPATYYGLDVNSMYPYVMTQHKLAGKLKSILPKNKVEYLKGQMINNYLILDCLIDTELPIFSYLQTNKLLFPIGKYRAILHHSEIEYALKYNLIREIYTTLVYEKHSYFNKYIEFFNQVKIQSELEGNKVWRMIAKLFMNSLYGKFGQLAPNRIHVGTIEDNTVWRLPIIDIDTGSHYQEIAWYGEVYRENREGETVFSIPAIAGGITANARILLYSYMEKAGLENCFYCDTDSLIVNEEGYQRLQEYIDPTKLGYLKLEKQSEEVTIYGCKDYEFGHEIKTKGVPRKATLLEQGRWSYLQFQGFISWLNDGAMGKPYATTRIKRRVSKYSKGVVSDNGKVTPIRINPLGL
jgi:DNA polymerase type B, organellar and viral